MRHAFAIAVVALIVLGATALYLHPPGGRHDAGSAAAGGRTFCRHDGGVACRSHAA